MQNEIISYLEMCRREGASLQRGMNFGLGKGHSVILMSTRANAPYRDRVEGDGTILIYEGHDVPKSESNPSPKSVDQKELTPKGSLTENGKFCNAVSDFKNDKKPELVRVYEKIKQGIWSYNGHFKLTDFWTEHDGVRTVFKFKLEILENQEETHNSTAREVDRTRIIPTKVKLEVWKRDQGKCVVCGATDELHFDHIIPYSKGGTSLSKDNIQLLCARHNIQKRDKIL